MDKKIFRNQGDKMKQTIMNTLKEKVKLKKRKIVIAEGWDEICLKATHDLLKEDLIDIVLLDNGTLKEKAKELNLNISKAEIIDFKNFKEKNILIEKLYELRKHKNLTKEDAEKLLEDENYFACMYVHCGYADALVGSKICSTAKLMKPVLQILRKKDSLVSEVSIIYIPKIDKVLFFSDASLNIDPNEEELARMALNASTIIKSFNIEPKIAMLSFSTHGSGGENEKTSKIKNAVKIVKEKFPNLLIDGEIQFDAAINPHAMKRKCPDSVLKGDANILIFPDLNSSNIFIHGLFQITDSEVLFSLISGLEKPAGILGRSTPKEFVINLIYAMALECNSKVE
jgi:phosphate acetyltransferase